MEQYLITAHGSGKKKYSNHVTISKKALNQYNKRTGDSIYIDWYDVLKKSEAFAAEHGSPENENVNDTPEEEEQTTEETLPELIEELTDELTETPPSPSQQPTTAYETEEQPWQIPQQNYQDKPTTTYRVKTRSRQER